MLALELQVTRCNISEAFNSYYGQRRRLDVGNWLAAHKLQAGSYLFLLPLRGLLVRVYVKRPFSSYPGYFPSLSHLLGPLRRVPSSSHLTLYFYTF